MALQAIYDKDKFEESVTEQYRDLYSERDGKMEFTGVAGIKTQADIDRLQGALNKEKNDHKDTKGKLSEWNNLGVSYSDVAEKLDKIPSLEAAASGNLDEEKIETIVQGRIKSLMAPVERENRQLKTDVEKLSGENTTFRNQHISRIKSDAVRTAASKLNVISQAMEDVIMLGERHFDVTEDGKVLTKDNVGITPGVDAETWLADMRDKRPYWWPASQGGGAGGGNGGAGFPNNPWSKDNWNLTEQGKVLREKGVEKAEQMAKAAGSAVGATQPQNAK